MAHRNQYVPQNKFLVCCPIRQQKQALGVSLFVLLVIANMQEGEVFMTLYFPGYLKRGQGCFHEEMKTSGKVQSNLWIF